MHRALACVIACLLQVSCTNNSAENEEPPVPTISVNDLMIRVVTPATNTLWGIEDPQTDEDWQVFIDAANEIIRASETIKVGGTGPNDNKWASDPAWDAFADQLIDAGVDALDAANNWDIEAMFTAGEVLYPPCEECHMQFHPDFQ